MLNILESEESSGNLASFPKFHSRVFVLQNILGKNSDGDGRGVIWLNMFGKLQIISLGNL